MQQFLKFTPAWSSTCFGQFLCPSSGVYSMYIRHWYMSYRFEDSFRAGPGWHLVLLESCIALHVSGSSSAHHQKFIHCTLGSGICHTSLKTAFERDQDGTWSCSKAVFKSVWHIPVPSVQWTNSRWWAEELPETCRASCRSKFGKLVHLVGFIIKKFVTMHGHMNVKKCPETFASPGITLVLLHLCPRAWVHLSENSLWRCYLSRHNHSPFTRCREKQIQSIYRLTIECWQALSLRCCWNTLFLSLSLDSITLALQGWDQIKRFILSIER